MKIEGGVGAAVSPLIDFETDCNLQLLLLRHSNLLRLLLPLGVNESMH